MKKFEFLLKINGNIICQRYFAVRNFNYRVIHSLELIDCLNECVGIIQEQLQIKSLDYLWVQYNPYEKQTEDKINRISIYDKEDVFDFEIRIDEKTIAIKRFTGNVYPQRVRYSVDVRELIPRIISSIQETLAEENLSVKYLNTVL